MLPVRHARLGDSEPGIEELWAWGESRLPYQPPSECRMAEMETATVATRDLAIDSPFPDLSNL